MNKHARLGKMLKMINDSSLTQWSVSWKIKSKYKTARSFVLECNAIFEELSKSGLSELCVYAM